MDFTERELSSLFVPEQHSTILTGPDDISLRDSNMLTPEDLLDLDVDNLASIEPLTLDKNPPAAKKHHSLAGTVFLSAGILLLLATFLAQVGWIYRDQLLANPQSRQLIEAACQHVTCNLPARHDPQAFEIIERHVRIHPDVRGILSLDILFANRAPFAQAAPGITLSLFDAQQQLIARRSFTYKDYLEDYSRHAPLFEAGQVQKVFLNLEDPGTDVTGFEFNFF
jgi:hypothetical protein